MNNRWEPFTDEEIIAIYTEMTIDDGLVYGYTKDDEPAYSVWRQLQSEHNRRGIALT